MIPLCGELVVPEGSIFSCRVRNVARRQRQTIDLNIVATSLNAPPLRARFAEETATESATSLNCGISLENIDRDEQYAFISTREVWDKPSASRHPLLTLDRDDGSRYAVLTKGSTDDEYILWCDQGLMATFSGNFASHEICIYNMRHALIAQVTGASGEEYCVMAAAQVDVGLIVLCLLGIDKCELVTG